MSEGTEERPAGEGWSIKIRNICIGLGALSGLILGLVANCRGEPIAEKTWITLRDQVNKQSALINKLHVRTVFLQAHEEGRTAANLQLQLEDLKKQLEKPARCPTSCAPGFQPSSTGACVPAAKAPAIKKAQVEVERDRAIKALEAERTRTAELTQRKLELTRKLTVIKAKGGSGEPTLKALPKKLDDVKAE